MRMFVSIVLGLVAGTAAYFYQNPDVVLNAPERITSQVAKQASSMEDVPDSFASITATSTPGPNTQVAVKPTPNRNSQARASADSTDRILELERKVHAGINAARTRNGVSPRLRWDDRLSTIARAHSDDMTNRGYFDHDNPEGLGPSDRIDRAGYNCWKGSHYGVAENITIELESANIDRMADGAVQGWLNSPGHRTNLLGRQYDRTGIGASFGTWRGYKAVYVTQVFC